MVGVGAHVAAGQLTMLSAQLVDDLVAQHAVDPGPAARCGLRACSGFEVGQHGVGHGLFRQGRVAQARPCKCQQRLVQQRDVCDHLVRAAGGVLQSVEHARLSAARGVEVLPKSSTFCEHLGPMST
jgi:hypothetical protein